MNAYLQPIFEDLYKDDGLCILARGLGIRQLFCKFIQGYCTTSQPENRRIVFCINVLGEEEAIRDTLRADGLTDATLFPTVVTSDILSGERSTMYTRGGVFIASSRIIINDLLKGIVEGKDICGFLVSDAHKIRETSIESFILRVFKQSNRNGFIKAFSDAPEKVLGFGKTERIMQLLFVKNLYLWPRFHHTVNTTLSKTQPEVIELSQPLSPSMMTVQSAILVAMETILRELKKSNSKIDPASLTLENGVFHSFSDSIRSQLEPEWHKLSYATKQLVTDLKTLRQLLDSLIRYDAITFYAYLLTIQESSLASTMQSPALWLTSSVAHNLFKCSKERVLRSVTLPAKTTGDASVFTVDGQKYVPVLEVPPKWTLVKEVLEEIKMDYRKKKDVGEGNIFGGRAVVIVKDDRSLLQLRDFLCAGNNGNDVLESRLRQFVMQQASHIRQQLRGGGGGGGRGGKGKGGGRGGKGVGGRGGNGKWRAATARAGEKSGSSSGSSYTATFASAPITEAEFERLSMENKLLMMFEKELHSTTFGNVYQNSSSDNSSEKAVSSIEGGNKRVSSSAEEEEDVQQERKKKRRTSTVSGGGKSIPAGTGLETDTARMDTDEEREKEEDVNEDADDVDPDALHASLLDPTLHLTLLTHSQCTDAYSPLSDLQPAYIVLLDPEVSIIRMIETYQAERNHYQAPQPPTKVYFLMYEESIEEHRYGMSLKHEKKSFDDLISKKAHMVVTLPEDSHAHTQGSEPRGYGVLDSRTHRRGASSSSSNSTSRVVVDIREFGSSLPSLLHLHQIIIFPVTLLVGDFILSPQICIERKGISDLFQSFASGRLYSQAEAMCRYYDLPCLLVEFSENNSFSLQGQSDIPSEIQINNICSKMSLLALAFPNLRILWSRSPHATVDIFKTLKENFEEADVDRAIQIGSDGASGSRGMGPSGDGNIDLGDTPADNIHMTVNDMLLSLPGINVQNCRKVTDAVESIAHLSSLSVEKLTPLIGPVNAKKLFAFFHNST